MYMHRIAIKGCSNSSLLECLSREWVGIDSRSEPVSLGTSSTVHVQYMKMTIVKPLHSGDPDVICLSWHWTQHISPLGTGFKFVHCAIAYSCTVWTWSKKRPQTELCAPLGIRILYMPTAVRGGAESLKGSHRMGDQPIFLKTSAPYSFMTTLSNEPTVSQIHLAGHYL